MTYIDVLFAGVLAVGVFLLIVSPIYVSVLAGELRRARRGWPEGD